MSVDPADLFRQEAADLLEQLERTLLDLEYAPNDAALIDSAFRALHTIKGSGAMFGFEAVAAFTHHVENAFELVRKGQVCATQALIALTLAAKDHVRSLIDEPFPSPETTAVGDELLAHLQEIVAGGTEGSDPLVPAAAERTFRIAMRLAADTMRMGTDPLLLLDELSELGVCSLRAVAADVPALEALDPTLCYIGWEIVLTTAQPRAAIESVFLFVIDDMVLRIDEDGAATQPSNAEILAFPQLVPPASIQPDPASSLGLPAISPAAQSSDRAVSSDRAPGAGDTIRVLASRLDDLMDRVGELVIAQSRLKQVAVASNDPQIKSVAEEIERLALDLRDTTMGVRMVQIGSLFGRFRRLVHDLGRDLGKHIVFETVGEDTEIDKTVSERLGDPLVHLIRNSIDHGLEPAAERIGAGKSPEGRLLLSAAHVGGEVLITISDDGRGLNRARIKQRAEQQGLLPASATPSDHDLFQCLFTPGFSTAAQVTSLSGRGVGMDVVRRTIEQLRGTIDMTSNPGEGTVIVLRLPLTLAIIDGLLVRVGNGRYVIPLSCVEECVQLTAAQDRGSQGRSLHNLRGGIVPFLRLREVFGCTTPADEYQKIVIVSNGDQRFGLVVDQIIGDHQTVIKSLSRLHAGVKMFSGATILGDGTVALILEVTQLMQQSLLADAMPEEPRRLAS